MACEAVSIAIWIFLASILALWSVPQVASSPSSPLVKDVCVSTSKEIVGFDTKLCIKTLEYEPRIVEAKDLLSISIAILEFAMSNVTKRQSYMQKQLKQPGIRPGYKYVLEKCEYAYRDFVLSFRSARGEIPGDPDTATYDIKVAYTDTIDTCRNAMTSNKISDAEISKGNDFTNLIGQVSFNTVERLPEDDV